MRVLVLGGAGFIGRHACAELRRRGHDVLIGTRKPAGRDPRLSAQLASVPRVGLCMERMHDVRSWRRVLGDVQVVVNCVGILRPRWRESYEAVHHRAVASLAAAVIEYGVRRFVHVSALGLTADALSGFIRSKWHGERAVLESGAPAVIVRPSLLDGADGYGSRWLRRIARWPVQFVPATHGVIAPLDVDDLAQAIATLVDRDDGASAVVELGGADRRSMAEHLAALRRAYTQRPARVIAVPVGLARAISHACDFLHVTPFSYGHLELLGRDNVPAVNALVSLLARAPRWIGIREAPVMPDRLRVGLARQP